MTGRRAISRRGSTSRWSFLAKNFATTVSPWVVTLEALAPFRAYWSRPAGEPPPLAYLDDGALREAGAIDIQLEVARQRAHARCKSAAAAPVACELPHSWWTIAQMLAHHTVNGCNLNAGPVRQRHTVRSATD